MFEIHSWSNILCVKSDDMWYEVTESFKAKKDKPFAMDAHAKHVEDNWVEMFPLMYQLKHPVNDTINRNC